MSRPSRYLFLSSGRLLSQDWKTSHQIYGVANADAHPQPTLKTARPSDFVKALMEMGRSTRNERAHNKGKIAADRPKRMSTGIFHTTRCLINPLSFDRQWQVLGLSAANTKHGKWNGRGMRRIRGDGTSHKSRLLRPGIKSRKDETFQGPRITFASLICRSSKLWSFPGEIVTSNGSAPDYPWKTISIHISTPMDALWSSNYDCTHWSVKLRQEVMLPWWIYAC